MRIEEFNIWIALGFFVAYFIFDIIYGKFILATQALEAEKGAVYSGLLGIISFSAILGAGANPFYGIPCVGGQALGTYFILRYERWRRAKEQSKNDVKNNT